MVKEHIERGSQLLLQKFQEFLFPVRAKFFFIYTIPQTGQYLPQYLQHQLHWLEREMAQWVHHKGSSQ